MKKLDVNLKHPNRVQVCFCFCFLSIKINRLEENQNEDVKKGEQSGRKWAGGSQKTGEEHFKEGVSNWIQYCHKITKIKTKESLDLARTI